MPHQSVTTACVVMLTLATLPLYPASAADPAGNFQGQTGSDAQPWTYPATGAPPPSAPGIVQSQTIGTGFLGGSPSYGASDRIATPTGNGAGTGTGIGLGSTSSDQPSTQTAIGSPDTPSTTPGGPPTAGTGNGLTP